MSFNGYILLSIITGDCLGVLVFELPTLLERSRTNTSAAEEPTVCRS